MSRNLDWVIIASIAIVSLIVGIVETSSDICPNQQTVFNGQVGVIFELLPASNQQAVINDFVENILLNSNFYGLAVDNLNGANRTLATAIPYPSTDKYVVGGYGSARSVNDFKNQVVDFNANIRPITKTSDINDALLYVATLLPAGTEKSALIIVGNHGSMIDASSPALADHLKYSFDIYTVAVGNHPAEDKLASLSSGVGFSFTGSSQQIADQIGLKLAISNPAIYCPPPVPSTVAPITSTIKMSSVSTVSPTVAPTTTVTTLRPTVGPCQCTGRWVYNGDLAIAFEFVMNSQGSENVTNFVQNTLLSNPDSYGLSNDVNGNQPSKLTLIPYPELPISPYPYGTIHTQENIETLIDLFTIFESDQDPAISDAFDEISKLKTDPYAKVVLLVASNGTDVAVAADSANKLKNAGYTIITVAQSVSADVFRPLASADKYALKIGDGNDNDVATQIANLLLDISFVCYDDGSSTPSPITRCPSTQHTTGSPTTSLPSCPSPYKGKIAAVFELNAMQTEIQDVLNFLSNNLYNSANYDFASDTQAVNIPYPNTDSYGGIGTYGDFTSLAALQRNIHDLYATSGFSTDADIADGLDYMLSDNLSAGGSKAVIIVVGHQEDANFGLTYQDLQTLKSQGYQVMSVAVGAGHGNLSPIADKPEWYFQVDDSNGQFVANQISSILCNL